MRFLICALLLAGCVTDDTALSIQSGRWTGYHDMVQGLAMQTVAAKPAPDSVKAAFAKCVADFTYQNMTIEERQFLDGYARGENEATVAELRNMDTAIKHRSGIGEKLTDANVNVLASACPADVASFHQLNL